MEISTVVGCKMMCNYCPQKNHVKNYSGEYSMSLEKFTHYMLTIPKHVEIIFAGMAEPWLNDMCTSMVKDAFDWGHPVGVYTTGVGMQMYDVEEIKDRKFIHFTLHLPDADNRMRLKITQEYKDIVRALIESPLKPQKMVIGRLHPEIEEITGPILDGSQGLYSRGGNLTHLAIPRKAGELHCPACGPQLNHNILLPNGDVLLCCMDYSQDHVLGNLNQVTYDELFVGEEYQRIMKGLKDETINTLCRKCEVSTTNK